MHEFTELIKALAWPLTTLLAIYMLRAELRLFMTRISEAISQAAQITIGKKGLDIKLSKKIEAVNTRVTAIQATQEQVKVVVRSKKELARPAVQIPSGLSALAAEYLHIEVTDYRTRLHLKNELAKEMGELVLKSDVSRDALISSSDEGLILAFVSAAVAQPEAGDLKRLLRAGSICKRLHVRYRIVIALTVLINCGLVPAEEETRIEQVLDLMCQGADEPLMKIIHDARGLLETVMRGEINAAM
jgi:hypothetical protein